MQSFGQEEGRVRVVQDLTNAQSVPAFNFDYFIKDHLGNTRMVLTDEQESDAYPAATMETANSGTEDVYYSKVEETRTVLPAGYPTDNTTNPNNYVIKVSGAAGGNKIGPGITLKVMAGDQFSIQASSWYRANGVQPGNPVSPLTDLLSALIGGVGGIPGGHLTAAQLQLQTNSALISPNVGQFLSYESAGAVTAKPLAFVNWVLFDNQMNYVSASSGFDQVGNDQEFKKHVLPNLPVTKSGYLYIYVSNETPNIDVFFDNLQVTHVRGPLLEENHYYPFGLTMAGISDKALKTGYVENKYRYNKGTELQNKEFFDGSGLELYTTDHRLFDPQLGRFVQVDAYANVFEQWSPYTYAIDDPILLNDPSGLAISDSSHPQEQALVTVTAQKASSSLPIIFTDSRPNKRNPNYVFGGNQPFHISYKPGGTWNRAITKNLIKGVGIGMSFIPIAKGLKAAYTLYKFYQAIKEAEEIPETAEKVADFALNKNGAAMKGWKGGSEYANDGREGGEILDKVDPEGNPITYKEYDVWPKVPGFTRGGERVVIGSDKSVFYTSDQYQTFIQLK